MSSLQLTRDEIDAHVGALVSASRTRGDWDTEQGTDFEDDVDRVRRNGLRRFFNAYRWSFLRPRWRGFLNAAYTTGTVGIASGVVTLTGGTFPAWSEVARLVVSGNSYEVASLDSGSQVTLVDTSVTVTAGATYSLQQWRISLPSTFGGFLGDVSVGTSENARPSRIIDVGEQRIRERYLRHDSDVYGVGPLEMCIYAQNHDNSAEQKWWMELWPTVDIRREIMGRYRVNPEDIDANNEYLPCGPQHSQTVLEAVLAEAEAVFLDDPAGVHAALYERRLQESINLDRTQDQADFLGPMGDAMGVGYDTGLGYIIDSSPSGITYPEGMDDYFD